MCPPGRRPLASIGYSVVVTEATRTAPGPRHDPRAVLRLREFRLLLANRIFSATGQTMLQAIMAWQVYQISGNVLDLGILGLVRFAPSLALSLVGGAVADSYKRKTIVLIAQSLPFGCAVVFAAATFGGC